MVQYRLALYVPDRLVACGGGSFMSVIGHNRHCIIKGV